VTTLPGSQPWIAMDTTDPRTTILRCTSCGATCAQPLGRVELTRWAALLAWWDRFHAECPAPAVEGAQEGAPSP
jgi:hypothetical protein